MLTSIFARPISKLIKFAPMKRISTYIGLLALTTQLFVACDDKKSTIADDSVFGSTPALKQVSEDIVKNPKDASLYFERGTILDGMELDSLAFEDYKMAISLDSTKAEYFSTVGDMLFEHKDISGSVPWFEQALKIDPKDVRAHMKMAKMFLILKDYTRSFAEINTVLRQDVYNAEAYYLKGMVYKDMNDTLKAISGFQTAVQVNPDFRPAVIQLGLMHSMRGDEIALQYFDNAFRMDTLDVMPLYARGVFYQNKEQYEKAKEEYKNTIMHDAQYTNAIYNMAYILLQQDSTEKALRQYDILTKINLDDAEAYYNRGLCYNILSDEARKAGKKKEADEYKTKAIADYKQALVFNENYVPAKEALQKIGG